jgi:oligosaccharide repeat unit polymerase
MERWLKLPASGARRPALRNMNPWTLVLCVYIAYNLPGLIDMPWSITDAYDKSLCWKLFGIGLLGLVSGYAVSDIASPSRAFSRARRLQPRTSKQLTCMFFVLFAGCVVFEIVGNRGIPLLMGESRFGNSALVSNLAPLYGFWLMIRTISDLESGRKIDFVQPLIYLAGILLLGYRSPVLAFVTVCYVYFVIFRVSGRKAVLVSLIAACALIGFAATMALFRVAQSYDVERFFTNIDFRFISEHRYLLPFVPALSMFDASQNTIATLGGSMREHLYGGLLLSNFETFLPGKHWGARNIVGDLVGARWIAGRPMSITPTLQGALFVDFGYIGVFAGFFGIAFCVARFYAYALRNGVLARFSFCYLLTLVLMSIHSGYWDVNFVFFLLFLIAIRIFDHLKLLARRA